MSRLLYLYNTKENNLKCQQQNKWYGSLLYLALIYWKLYGINLLLSWLKRKKYPFLSVLFHKIWIEYIYLR